MPRVRVTEPPIPFFADMTDTPPSCLYTLGPEGTFSDQAAQRLRAALDVPPVPIRYTRTIADVMVRTEADPAALGVLPIENSVAGTVTQTQDNLVRHHLAVLWELNVRVRFSLLSNAPLDKVEAFLAHPQAFDQCAEFLARQLPNGQVRFANSNVAAGVEFLEGKDGPPLAAIVPLDFGSATRGYLAATDIQDFKTNTTRFLATRLGREGDTPDFSRHKTSVFVEPIADRPGLLYDLLSVFNRHGINLCRLESRPAKVTQWVYVFFVDFINNARSADCLRDLQATDNHITVLGSYDTLE